MLFVVTALDKDNALELRIATRAAHFEYGRETCVVRLGGPFLGSKGEMNGSLIIIDVPDLDAAKKWLENDPYKKAGLFKSSDVRPWKPTFNPSNAAF